MKKSVLFMCFVFGFSFLFSACSGTNAKIKPVSELNVEMSEFKFSPSEMVVFAGEEITLNLSNHGSVNHDLSILKKGVTAQMPFDREKQVGDILFYYSLGPNESGLFKFTLEKAGEYQVVCGIQGHMEAGMIAKLTAQ